MTKKWTLLIGLLLCMGLVAFWFQIEGTKEAEARSRYMRVAMPSWFKKLSDLEKRKYIADLDSGKWVEVQNGPYIRWVDINLLVPCTNQQLVYVREKSVRVAAVGHLLEGRSLERTLQEGPYFQEIYYVNCESQKFTTSESTLIHTCNRNDYSMCFQGKELMDIPKTAFLDKIPSEKVKIPVKKESPVFIYVCSERLK